LDLLARLRKNQIQIKSDHFAERTTTFERRGDPVRVGNDSFRVDRTETSVNRQGYSARLCQLLNALPGSLDEPENRKNSFRLGFPCGLLTD
ncbi:MAG: hypothetical protein ACKVT0_10310, partial [Planctomycetaceae bacterium]